MIQPMSSTIQPTAHKKIAVFMDGKAMIDNAKPVMQIIEPSI